MPRVSVILPAYNEAERIAGALASVRAQTYDDWEVVVADDGSTDATAEVARRFADPRVRVVQSPVNRGLASTRNLAIAHARGELLALLDADDAWLPEYLERLLALHDAHAGRVRVGVASCNARLVVDGKADPVTYGERFGFPEDVSVWSLLESNPIFVGVLAPKRVIEEVGGFAEGLRSSEDLDLWLRVLEAGYQVVSTREPLVLYRIRPGQLSGNLAGMAAGSREVYARALERHRLSPRERRRAGRVLRLQTAVERVAPALDGRAAGLRARAGVVARALGLIAVVVAENPPRWPRWARMAAGALRRGR